MKQTRLVMHHAYRLLVKWARYLHVYLTLFGFALLLFFAVTGFMLNHEPWFLPQQTIEGKIPTELLEISEDRTNLLNKLQDDFLIQGDLESIEYSRPDNAYYLSYKPTPGNAAVQVVIQKSDGHTLVTQEKTGAVERFVEGTIPKEMFEPWSDKKELIIVEKLRKDYGVKGEMKSLEPPKPESRTIEVKFHAPGYSADATISTEDGKTRVKHRATGLAGLFLDLHRNKSSGDIWGYVVDAVAILFVIVSVTGLILWTSLRARAQHGLAVIALGLAVSLAIYYYYVPR